MMVLDKRQRAMLREMGIQVWQPAAETTGQAVPSKMADKVANPISSESVLQPDTAATEPAVPARVETSPAQVVRKTARPEESAENLAWRVGAVQTLYAETTSQNENRWLVLLEAPAGALAAGFNPFGSDAGKLLDNMLRAAKLHVAGAVLFAPLVRSGMGGGLPGALKDVLANANPDVVLVMGRLAAQALLQSTEPLAKLRGRIHTVQGQQTVITIDPTYLLRNPLEKAKAWDDLCLGLSVIGVAHPVSTP